MIEKDLFDDQYEKLLGTRMVVDNYGMYEKYMSNFIRALNTIYLLGYRTLQNI